jgi:hypothetical protein
MEKHLNISEMETVSKFKMLKERKRVFLGWLN